MAAILPMADAFVWGSASLVGARPSNEDVHVIANLRDYFTLEQQDKLKDDDFLYCGVFDGHGGNLASSFCGEMLHEHLVRSRHFPSNMRLAFREAYDFTNRHFTRENYLCFSCGGTTALTAVLTRDTVYVANAGDSRAACRYTSGRLHRVTTDHKPGDLAENARIERADSAVVNQYGIDRLAGVLSVSRGIGDMDFQAKGFICTPDVFAIPAQQLDILLLACDGLWDVLDESVLDRAAELLAEALAEPGARSPYSVADAVALQLAHLAIRAGSTDNVTVVVGFRTSLFPPECTDRAPRPTAHFAFDL